MPTITRKENNGGAVFKIQVKYKDKGSGKVITKSTTFKATDTSNPTAMLRQATVFAEEYEKQVKGLVSDSNKRLQISPDTLFRDYADMWLERCKEENSPSYYVNCLYAQTHFNEYIGGYKLKEINPVIIQNFYDILDRKKKQVETIIAKPTLKKMMKAKGITYSMLRYEHNITSTSLNSLMQEQNVKMKTAERIADILGTNVTTIFNVKKSSEKYAWETINKIKRVVRAILAQAKKQRLITDNWASADYINFPKKPKQKIDFMTDEVAKQFFATVQEEKDLRIKTAMTILLLTGIRRGELCGLEWQDIDLENKTLTVRQSVVDLKGFGKITKDPKTETSKRTITMSQTLVDCLTEYKQWYDDQAEQLGDVWVYSDRLMIQWNGESIAPGTLRLWLNNTLDKANLEHKTVHSLRHTNITMQIAAGVPIVTVANRAGHARSSTTLDIYSHLLKSSDKEAADALDKVFE